MKHRIVFSIFDEEFEKITIIYDDYVITLIAYSKTRELIINPHKPSEIFNQYYRPITPVINTRLVDVLIEWDRTIKSCQLVYDIILIEDVDILEKNVLKF